MTQKEFGSRLFVSEKTISSWENGISYPSLANLEQICKTFNIEFGELVDEQDTKSKTTLFIDILNIVLSFVFLLPFIGVDGYFAGSKALFFQFFHSLVTSESILLIILFVLLSLTSIMLILIPIFRKKRVNTVAITKVIVYTLTLCNVLCLAISLLGTKRNAAVCFVSLCVFLFFLFFIFQTLFFRKNFVKKLELPFYSLAFLSAYLNIYFTYSNFIIIFANTSSALIFFLVFAILVVFVVGMPTLGAASIGVFINKKTNIKTIFKVLILIALISVCLFIILFFEFSKIVDGKTEIYMLAPPTIFISLLFYTNQKMIN